MRLNSKITITTKAKTYNPNTGGNSTVETDTTWWANVMQLDEDAVLNFGMNQQNKNNKLIIRKTTLPKGAKITYNGVTLRIHSVADYKQEGRYLRVLAVEDRN